MAMIKAWAIVAQLVGQAKTSLVITNAEISVSRPGTLARVGWMGGGEGKGRNECKLILQHRAQKVS